MLKALVLSMRPQQWVKNTVLFAGLVFSFNLFQVGFFLKVLLAFALFCLLTSGVYILNDILDLKSDRAHPTKSKRPIASGELKVFTALFYSIAFILAAILFSFYLGQNFGLVALAYFVLNLAYSQFLKHIVIIDVMAISLGFVLRAVAGAVVINVEISSWLVVCTTLLALFLGFGKRRYEIVLLESKAEEYRKSLADYSPYFLDQLISVVTASTVVAYAFYTLSPEVEAKLGTSHMALTIPFVLYGVFRYLYLIHQKEEGGSPTRALLTDKPLIIDILLWLFSVILIVYL
jgi:4-hydroxybenzoate polyprenyltransferase